MSAWVIDWIPSIWTFVERDLGAERQRRQQRQLVRGIEAADVEGRIAFGVALGLRLLQHIVEGAMFFLHLGQDVVAGAVQDAIDAANLIAGQRLAHGLDDRDAAGDRRFEIQRDAVLLGQSRQIRAVQGQQSLVGGHDVLLGRRARLRPQPARRLHAPPISSTKQSISGSVASFTGSSTQRTSASGTPRSLERVRRGNGGHHELPADRLAQPRAMLLKQMQQPGADSAEAGDADPEWRLHCCG